MGTPKTWGIRESLRRTSSKLKTPRRSPKWYQAYLKRSGVNIRYNLRYLWILDSSYADLSFLYTLHTGEPENAHLGGAEYLAVLETNHGTPYYLNLHCGDIAHTLILGATGGGKSFFVNFLLTHAQKYEPVTYVFEPPQQNLWVDSGSGSRPNV